MERRERGEGRGEGRGQRERETSSLSPSTSLAPFSFSRSRSLLGARVGEGEGSERGRGKTGALSLLHAHARSLAPPSSLALSRSLARLFSGSHSFSPPLPTRSLLPHPSPSPCLARSLARSHGRCVCARACRLFRAFRVLRVIRRVPALRLILGSVFARCAREVRGTYVIYIYKYT